MSLLLFVVLAGVGAVAGFGAGFIGLGGGILLFPLLLYLPPLLGLEGLAVKTVAALVISQVFFSGLIGGAAHWRSGRVHPRLTFVAAAASGAGSFIGGLASKWASEWYLLLLFGVVMLLAAAMMFLPGLTAEQELISKENLRISVIPLAVLSCATGIVVGLIGAGNFLFVPLLIYILKVPTRITIGSSLVIHVLNTFAGFLGKLLTGQIPFLMTAAVVIGACAGALAGERSHGWASPRILRYAYGGVLAVAMARIWITLLS